MKKIEWNGPNYIELINLEKIQAQICENQDLEEEWGKMILTLSDCVTKKEKKGIQMVLKTKLKVVWLNCTRKVCPDYQKNIS